MTHDPGILVLLITDPTPSELEGNATATLLEETPVLAVSLSDKVDTISVTTRVETSVVVDVEVTNSTTFSIVSRLNVLMCTSVIYSTVDCSIDIGISFVTVSVFVTVMYSIEVFVKLPRVVVYHRGEVIV